MSFRAHIQTPGGQESDEAEAKEQRRGLSQEDSRQRKLGELGFILENGRTSESLPSGWTKPEEEGPVVFLGHQSFDTQVNQALFLNHLGLSILYIYLLSSWLQEYSPEVKAILAKLLKQYFKWNSAIEMIEASTEFFQYAASSSLYMSTKPSPATSAV